VLIHTVKQSNCTRAGLLRSAELVGRLEECRRSFLVALEDNQAVHYAFSKGRSSKWPVNTMCRRKAALECASDICMLTVWCGTKRMPMDRLSRERIVRDD